MPDREDEYVNRKCDLEKIEYRYLSKEVRSHEQRGPEITPNRKISITIRGFVFYFDIYSALIKRETKGQMRIPTKKLLIPWIISKGRPAAIQASIPLKSSPKRSACAGA